MSAPLIYHGTPLTPRSALLSVMSGRAGCVSFYRPDDVEAVEAVCPQVMFRSRRVFILASGGAGWAGVGPSEPRSMVAGLLCVAGAATVRSGPLRTHSRQSRRTVANQRWPTQRLAVRAARFASVAYGHGREPSAEDLRPLLSRVHRMDRRPEERAGWLYRLPSKDGRGWASARQSLAAAAHAQGRTCRPQLSFPQRRLDQPSAERASL